MKIPEKTAIKDTWLFIKRNYSKEIKIITIICILVVLFVRNCMFTNAPDKFTLSTIDEYYKTNKEWPDLERYLTLEPKLRIDFYYEFYGDYFNTNYLKMYAYCNMDNRYRELYIQEASYKLNGKTEILIKDKTFDIPDSNIVLDENKEPILINGKVIFYKGIYLNKKMSHHFIKGRLGEEKEIEIHQIYRFNNKELVEENYKYKVICGGLKFDPIRLLYPMFPP